MSKQSKTEQARAQAYAAKQAAYAAKSDRRKKDNRTAVIASVVVLALAFASQLIYSNFGPGHSVAASASPAPSSSPSPSATVPSKAIAQNRTWNGTINFNHGALAVALDGKKAPQAVANFISLAKKGYFKNTSCHRLVNSGIYVLQCGDPTGTGQGGPGYSFGPIENAPANNVYDRGVLAMARVGGNGSSMGSQFFIVYRQSTIPADSAGGYTVFGHITGGLDNLTPTINGGIQPDANGNKLSDGKPKVPAIISSINLK